MEKMGFDLAKYRKISLGAAAVDDPGYFINDFGASSLEGGDVQPIGNGTVAIGMSERSQARMIELVAKLLFAGGGAEPVIVAVMTRDRTQPFSSARCSTTCPSQSSWAWVWQSVGLSIWPSWSPYLFPICRRA